MDNKNKLILYLSVAAIAYSTILTFILFVDKSNQAEKWIIYALYVIGLIFHILSINISNKLKK